MHITSSAAGSEIGILLQGYIDSEPRLGIWRNYPDISDFDNAYVDGWACRSVSTEFAAFALTRGWDAVIVHGEDPVEGLAFDHHWVRVSRPGTLRDVDWTARQFHDLFVAEGHDPNVLSLPWPLVWVPHLIEQPGHLVVGKYGKVTVLDTAPAAGDTKG